jgi:hypothetical protein
MSISQNFPSTRPSLNLNFARSQKLDPRITFTRSSTATYTGGDGLIKIAEADTPRFDFDPTTGDCLGLLIEESRTNLVLRSNTFNTYWSSVSATCVFTQNVTGPDGVSNGAWTIDDQSTANDSAGFEQSFSITPSTSTNYCLSIFAKQGTATYFDFYAFFTGTSTKGTYFRYNFSTDTISVGSADGGGITPTIYGKVAYPNGWYRFYFVVNDANSGLNNAFQYRLYPASRDAGVTGTTLFYGAQFEIGSFPTSYIPTVASTVTRSADRASITGANFSSWYNQTEGTMFVDINSAPIATAIQVAYDINNGTTSERIFTRRLAAGTISTSITDNNTLQATIGGFAIAASARYRSSLAYKLNDFSGSVNGDTNDTASSGTLPTVTVMNIGAIQAGTNQTNGTIARITYYPVRLSNSQLQSLTK